MPKYSQVLSQPFHTIISVIIITFITAILISVFGYTPAAFSQSSAINELVHKELVTVYQTNLIRRENGLAPLRWNNELSQAAREFAEDTIAVRDEPYCGHTDSQGRKVIDRIEATGYQPIRWAENAACGYLEPNVVVPSWFASDSHRRNMLIPELREIGVGYYLDDASGSGYVVQDFAYDGIAAPIIINNEAPTAESTEVMLYIYDTTPRSGFNGIGAAQEMMISNSPHFKNAQWEPFTVEKSWFLNPGNGWRSVFVKKRDAIGRVTTSSDSIYLGESIPTAQLTLSRASTIERALTWDSLLEQFPQAQNWSSVQMGRYWVIDDKSDSFSLFHNSGTTVDDVDAMGRTAHRLTLSAYDAASMGENATLAAAWMEDAPPNTPMVASVRVKVANNRTSDRVLKIWAESGTTKFDPVIVTADDFEYPEIYQDISIPLEFVNPDPGDLLVIRFYHYGGIEVSIDTISFFTDNQPFEPSLSWSSSSPVSRQRGFVVRAFSDENDDNETGDLFDVGQNVVTGASGNPSENLPESQATEEAATPAPTPTQDPDNVGITISDTNLEFEVVAGGEAPDFVSLDVLCVGCDEHLWWIYSQTSWLTAYRFFNDIRVVVDPGNLPPGVYEGQATVGAPSVTGIPVQLITVQLIVKNAAGDVPPTNTPVLPTSTPVPPTSTRIPPTSTSVPSTSTPVPLTGTPLPTNTPAPTNTPVSVSQPIPVATATATPTSTSKSEAASTIPTAIATPTLRATVSATVSATATAISGGNANKVFLPFTLK